MTESFYMDELQEVMAHCVCVYVCACAKLADVLMQTYYVHHSGNACVFS